jgi:hypothetical protein
MSFRDINRSIGRANGSKAIILPAEAGAGRQYEVLRHPFRENERCLLWKQVGQSQGFAPSPAHSNG